MPTQEKTTFQQKIQKDLDNGMFNKICSNEETFKKYVFLLIFQEKDQAYHEGFEAGAESTADQKFEIDLEVARKQLKNSILEWIENSKPEKSINAISYHQDIRNFIKSLK